MIAFSRSSSTTCHRTAPTTTATTCRTGQPTRWPTCTTAAASSTTCTRSGAAGPRLQLCLSQRGRHEHDFAWRAAAAARRAAVPLGQPRSLPLDTPTYYHPAKFESSRSTPTTSSCRSTRESLRRRFGTARAPRVVGSSCTTTRRRTSCGARSWAIPGLSASASPLSSC